MTDSNHDYPPPGQGSDNDGRGGDLNPTVAAFAPTSNGESHNRSRASVLIHQKSPLLLATPPQVTRALAYSHSFILPLSHFAGLLSWTTGDPWESFLLVASFWFVVLYGNTVLRYAGPLVLVAMLTFGMYTRRYSPLSSTILTGEKKTHKRGSSDDVKQRKSLDEILDTLQTFTARCNILLDPLLRLTDFLSTQTTATAATTRPALTTLLYSRGTAVLPVSLAQSSGVVVQFALSRLLSLAWTSRNRCRLLPPRMRLQIVSPHLQTILPRRPIRILESASPLLSMKTNVAG
jgi:hypothetical protein